MEKNSLVVLLLLCLPLCTVAQGRKKSFVKKDLFTASGGLAGGLMVDHPTQNIYIISSAEYFMEQWASVKADLYWFLPDYHFEGQLQKNSSAFIGGSFHFPYERWDINFAVQPGLAFPGLAFGTNASEVQRGIEPVFSVSGGFTYFLWQNLHAFFQAGYVHGNFFPEGESSYLLDEIRLSAGIGFNVFFNRYAPYERKRVRF